MTDTVTDLETNDRARAGRRLREARLATGASQVRLAQAIGVTQVDVSRWERGKHMPSPRYREKLAEALDLPEGFFHPSPGDGAQRRA